MVPKILQLKMNLFMVSRIETVTTTRFISSLHAGKFFMHLKNCRLLIFFKIVFFEKFFQEYHQRVN